MHTYVKNQVPFFFPENLAVSAKGELTQDGPQEVLQNMYLLTDENST